jgi:polyisoprenoid-binding protein YceI
MKAILTILILGVLGYVGWTFYSNSQYVSTPAVPVETAGPALTPPTSATDAAPLAPTEAKAVSIDNSRVTVTLVGSMSGQSFSGSVGTIQSSLVLTSTQNIAGTLIADMTTLTTDNPVLTALARSEKGFDVKKYPTATFTITQDLTNSTCEGTTVKCIAPNLYGTLVVRGISKPINFPLIKSLGSYQATLTIDPKSIPNASALSMSGITFTLTIPLK